MTEASVGKAGRRRGRRAAVAHTLAPTGRKDVATDAARRAFAGRTRRRPARTEPRRLP